LRALESKIIAGTRVLALRQGVDQSRTRWPGTRTVAGEQSLFPIWHDLTGRLALGYSL
jgi:hypothetical protein